MPLELKTVYNENMQPKSGNKENKTNEVYSQKSCIMEMVISNNNSYHILYIYYVPGPGLRNL